MLQRIDFRQRVSHARPYNLNQMQAAQLHHFTFKLESIPPSKVWHL
jgi:hypothetical protein